MQIVTRKNLSAVLKTLATAPELALDTETTGLKLYQGDRLFSLIIATETEEFYFSFQDYPLEGQRGLDRVGTFAALAPIFSNTKLYWFITNAKFDLAALANEGAEIRGTIHCTVAIGRVEKNNRLRYGLDALAKEIGHEKNKEVEEYIAEHKLYRFEPGDDDDAPPEKVPEFNRVPFELICRYACKDARLSFLIGAYQKAKILATQEPVRPLEPVFRNELALTPVLFQMERTGVLIDREYVEAGLVRERKRAEEIREQFAKLTGKEFIDSAKCLAPVFDSLGEHYPLTEKGRPSFTADSLDGMKTPVASMVREHRDALKRANTYYKNFLYYADAQNRIHLDMRQGGTLTGRLSAAHPNLQNLTKTKDKGAEFPVRRSFIPTPGFSFGFLDFDQAEYRLMLERAKQMELIELVKGGLDVHEATAKMMGVDRQSAKTINFMLLYGGGIAKLCMALFEPTLPLETLKALGRLYIYKMTSYQGIELHRTLVEKLSEEVKQKNLMELKKAHALLEQYYSALPDVKTYSRDIQRVAKERGQIINWLGRRCYYFKGQSTHMAANHDIQGGVADIVKVGMVAAAPLFKGKKSRLMLQIHDELMLEFTDDEKQIMFDLRDVMEKAYPYKFLPLTCGLDFSRQSWADKQKFPSEAARDKI